MYRNLIPTFDYVLVDRVVHKNSILDISDAKNNDMFDIVVESWGPDCVLPLKKGMIIECSSGVLSLPIGDIDLEDGEDHTFCLIREKDIVGMVSFATPGGN